MKPASILAEPTPHQEASDFIRGKPIVSRSVFKGMLPDLKGRAFSVAGIQAANVLQDIRDSLASLPEGALWDKVKADIAADVIPFYVDPAAEPELQAKQQAAAEAKAELLLRVHGFQAYAAAQYQVLDRQRPEFPFWQYHSMEDARVRPTHAALDGVVMPADSPFWADHYPPWEWGCRCIVTPLPLSDVEKMIEQDKNLPPEQHRVIGPAAQRQLEQSGLLIRNGGAHNVASGFAKGDQAAFHWDPSTLRMPLEQIRRRYDPEVFTAFEAWAKRTHLQGGSGMTVWEWASQEPAGKTRTKPKAKAQAPVAVAAPPQTAPGSGTPVSDALDVKIRAMAVRSEVLASIAAIGKVHTDGKLPRIPITAAVGRGAIGVYCHNILRKATRIGVRATGPWKHLTTAHEVGHFLDHQSVDIPGVFASEKSAALAKWRDAVKQSAAYQEIAALSGEKNQNYFLSRRECFARSYAQWIATRSGDAAMLAELDRVAASTQPWRQWKSDDFAPIASALDAVFAAKGWRQ
jgi:SPP1 gp7 family putative phage head morphogenesis protein